ncbi:MAG: hypothetical protein RL095_3181 [Verrucomicrobiota bacterium]|jgi:hypothetical protein
MKPGHESEAASQLRLASYLHGELTPQERQAFEKEIESNPELAAEVAEYRQLSLELEIFLAPPAPLTLGETHRERILRRGILLSRRRQLEIALSFLAGAALVGLGLILFRPAPAPGDSLALNTKEQETSTSAAPQPQPQSRQRKNQIPNPTASPVSRQSRVQEQSHSLRDGIRDRYLENFYAKLELDPRREEELKRLISQRSILLGNQRLLARDDNERHELIEETAAQLEEVNSQIHQMLGNKITVLHDYRRNLSGRLIVEAMNRQLAVKKAPTLDDKTSEKISQVISSLIKPPLRGETPKTEIQGSGSKLESSQITDAPTPEAPEETTPTPEAPEETTPTPEAPEETTPTPGVDDFDSIVLNSHTHSYLVNDYWMYGDMYSKIQVKEDHLQIPADIQEQILFASAPSLTLAQLIELSIQLKQGLPLIPGTFELPAP